MPRSLATPLLALAAGRLAAPLPAAAREQAWTILNRRLEGPHASRVRLQAVAPTPREPLLVRGDAEAVTGSDSTLWFALEGLGIRREDGRLMHGGDHGVEMLSDPIPVSTAMAERRPVAEEVRTGRLPPAAGLRRVD